MLTEALAAATGETRIDLTDEQRGRLALKVARSDSPEARVAWGSRNNHGSRPMSDGNGDATPLVARAWSTLCRVSGGSLSCCAT
jgi:hypothetical protein